MKTFDGEVTPFGTQTVTTASVADAMKASREFAYFVLNAMQRFAEADWGEINSQDKKSNNKALKKNGYLLGRYKYKGPERRFKTLVGWDRDIYIITDYGQTVTTVCFCNER